MDEGVDVNTPDAVSGMIGLWMLCLFLSSSKAAVSLVLFFVSRLMILLFIDPIQFMYFHDTDRL